MAIAIQELATIRPEALTIGAHLKVNIEYLGEVRDPKTGIKEPGIVSDKFHAEITGKTEIEDSNTGFKKPAYILNDRVHEIVVPADNLIRGRLGIMRFEQAEVVQEAPHKPKPKTERELRESIGLPGKKQRVLPLPR